MISGLCVPRRLFRRGRRRAGLQVKGDQGGGGRLWVLRRAASSSGERAENGGLAVWGPSRGPE